MATKQMPESKEITTDENTIDENHKPAIEQIKWEKGGFRGRTCLKLFIAICMGLIPVFIQRPDLLKKAYNKPGVVFGDMWKNIQKKFDEFFPEPEEKPEPEPQLPKNHWMNLTDVKDILKDHEFTLKRLGIKIDPKLQQNDILINMNRDLQWKKTVHFYLEHGRAPHVCEMSDFQDGLAAVLFLSTMPDTTYMLFAKENALVVQLQSTYKDRFQIRSELGAPLEDCDFMVIERNHDYKKSKSSIKSMGKHTKQINELFYQCKSDYCSGPIRAFDELKDDEFIKGSCMSAFDNKAFCWGNYTHAN